MPRPLASLASKTQCVPAGPVEDVDDLNRITRLRAEPALQGGDVGVSAHLSDGRSIWMFGDTLRDKKFSGAGFVRNSMLLVEPDCLQVVLPESGGAIIPDRDDGVGYWPMSVATLDKPGYALVMVAAQRVRTTDSDDADTRRPMWGAAAVVSGEWLYLYGTAREPDPPLGTGFALDVARVAPDHVADPDRWTYWDGSGWNKRPGSSSALIPVTDGVSQTLSVFERDGRWYAYMPLAHPDILEQPGSVIVSYSRNSTDSVRSCATRSCTGRSSSGSTSRFVNGAGACGRDVGRRPGSGCPGW
ncbi:MAG: DUF4185 domain-containing protein [Actinomycetota bacterium]|nr:DUF4185 domain-containing protein [Actinomycetota bacterium]